MTRVRPSVCAVLFEVLFVPLVVAVGVLAVVVSALLLVFWLVAGRPRLDPVVKRGDRR